MKRAQLIAFCLLLLCSLLLIVNVGTVMAYNSGYYLTQYLSSVNPVTIDGKWTTADEWHDGEVWDVGPTPNLGKFVFKFAGDQLTNPTMQFCLEFADSTNNPGDVWQICIDGPDSASATAPMETGFKIEIVGHNTLTVYKGTGTGWSTTTTSAVAWSNSLATSPHDPATHYICEIQFDRIALAGAGSWASTPPSISRPYGVRVAMYDASKPSQGWVAWPPASSADNPSTWGVINGSIYSLYPEGLTIGVMVLVSTVAVIVGTRYFRKRPKTENLSRVKL